MTDRHNHPRASNSPESLLGASFAALDADLAGLFDRLSATGGSPDLFAGIGHDALQATQQGEAIRDWAEDDLYGAFAGWSIYKDQLGIAIPTNLHDLLEADPKKAAVLERLYATRRRIGDAENSAEMADTMHLALVPWSMFRFIMSSGGDLSKELAPLREKQGRNKDRFGEKIERHLQNGTPMYRDPDNLATLLTAKDYLDKKLAQDGDWGIMLTQTAPQDGITLPPYQIVNELIDNGCKHFEVGDEPVDAMGIFEFLALTLQTGYMRPGFTLTWLLANRVQDTYDFELYEAASNASHIFIDPSPSYTPSPMTPLIRATVL